MIEVKNLVKRYSGGRPAVNDISFKIEAGEIVGFLGPNGAGKSTTMNILTGYLSASEGSVSVGGFDILQQPNRAKSKIGFLPEQPPLYIDMTVEEYLDFMYELKGVKLPREQHIEEICRLTKIDNVYTRLIRNLSKGYRQRVGIAQALLGNPDVLILDEPTVGLDPKQIIEIRSLIKSLGRGHTVILSSHILSEIEAVCERIIIINNGKIVADGSTDALVRNYTANNSLTVCIEGDQADALELLRGIDGVVSVSSNGPKGSGINEFSVKTKNSIDRRREIFKAVADSSMIIMEMHYNSLTLEDVFIRLTSPKDGLTDAKASTPQKREAKGGNKAGGNK